MSAASVSSSSTRYNNNNDSTLTFEATMAKESMNLHPDKIHWERDASFRSQPYRQLHHQNGLIGTFQIRLLEASELQRSYWSALALGPMKLLGLSTAHGAVSSYVSFHLDYQHIYDAPSIRSSSGGSSNHRTDGGDGICDTAGTRNSARGAGAYNNRPHNMDQKLPAKRRGSNTNNNNNNNHNDNKKNDRRDNRRYQTVTSPIIPNNDNPVWTDCSFDLPFRKGAITEDGMRILLQMRVDEDANPVENLVPGVPSYGDDSRLLGKGVLDLTSLCLGQTLLGQPQVGVIDAWVPIFLNENDESNNNNNNNDRSRASSVCASPACGGASPNPNMLHASAAAAQMSSSDLDSLSISKQNSGDSNKKDGNNNNADENNDGKMTGKVRVLVSYLPHGINPQEHDYVALETFARRSLRHASCQPVMPPLLPLLVLERQGPYLKVQYQLPNRSGTGNNNNHHTFVMRIHRNSCFVIERKNLLDNTIDLALKPTDMFMSSPIGQTTCAIMGPVVNAGKELIMPAMLSLKLLGLVARTAGSAGLAGVTAVTGTIVGDTITKPFEHNYSDKNKYQKQRERATERIAQL